MGEVYRARDPRLGREVAIKVLSKAFSRDRERLGRFEQEARTAGALNHPNLLSVFDVGMQDETPYLVTELLEGTTLRERLRSGPIPVRKAVELGEQIAQGLAAAHEKGVVHRDLKPENVFLCRDGRAKILDFGIAKLLQSDDSRTQTSLQPEQTQTGVVLGTVGYMSPEQVRGQNADQRSDIFCFGAMLYEMVSGQRAFPGGSAAEAAGAILHTDPPDLLAARDVPVALDRIVRHCLEKNPEERFQSARDLAFHLGSLSSTADSGTAAALAQRKTPGGLQRLWWVLVPLGLVLVAACGWWLAGRRIPAPRLVQFQRLTDFAGLEETPALSPDGKSVAFVADSTGSRQIWIRLLAGGPALQITRDAGDHLNPRWSQDSASLIYYTPARENEDEGTLWEVSALGGAPRRLAPSLSDADVSHSGKHLTFFRLGNKQVELVVSDGDGSNQRVVAQFAPSFGYRCPRWSPDDKTIAYVHSLENWTDDVYSVSESGGQPQRLTRDAMLMSGLTWLPDGSGIVYSSARGSTLLYLPILHLWQVSTIGGEPRQLTFGESADADPDIDRNWRLVSSRKRMQFDIWKFPVDGDPVENVRRAVRITQQTAQIQTPTVSPLDRELAYLSDTGGHGNIWVLRLSNGETRQITFEKSEGKTVGVPIWSPDGSYITFAGTERAEQGRTIQYWVVHPDGSDLHLAISEGAWATWSGDSRWLYYSESSPVRATGSFRLMKVPVAGGTPVLVRTDNARGPAVAPDGSALFYVVPLQNLNGSMNYELRVAQPEDGPSKVLARIPGTRVPLWQGLHPVISGDGKWLAMPLDDSLGTDIWIASTSDGKMRRITDFGQRRTFIARRVAWSSDGKWLFAAVGEGDADIVLFDGLLK